MRDIILTSLVTASALFAGQAEAVAVNPLPKPANITWGTSGCFSVGSLKLDAPDHKVLSSAFYRITKTITEVNGLPAATEAPIGSFQPFQLPTPI